MSEANTAVRAARDAGADAAGTVTVLVVDDSQVARRLLTAALEEDPAFEVVGEAANGNDAVAQALRLRPSLITMDLEMPGMDGLAAIAEIMAQAPTRILVVTSHPTYRGLDARREARARGALETIAKPGSTADQERLRGLARLLATVPVLPHVDEARRKRRAAREAASLAPQEVWRSLARARRAAAAAEIRLVAVGASTGGPGVLKEMLGALPADFAAPIVIVQHLSELHAGEFVAWLGRGARLSVREAVPGARLEPGTAYVALRGAHVAIAAGGCARGWIEACDERPRDGNCPSIDVLFESIARSHGAAAAGVLLTGMGRDGARGLLRLREAGGVTLVQDESTSCIFGMPGTALGLGAAQMTVARRDLAGALVYLVHGTARAGL